MATINSQPQNTYMLITSPNLRQVTTMSLFPQDVVPETLQWTSSILTIAVPNSRGEISRLKSSKLVGISLEIYSRRHSMSFFCRCA